MIEVTDVGEADLTLRHHVRTGVDDDCDLLRSLFLPLLYLSKLLIKFPVQVVSNAKPNRSVKSRENPRMFVIILVVVPVQHSQT